MPWGLCVKVPVNNPLPVLRHIQNIHLFPLSLRMLQPFSSFLPLASTPFGKTLNLNPQPMLARTLTVLWLLILETHAQPCCRRENVNTCVPINTSQTSKPNHLITTSGTLDITPSVFCVHLSFTFRERWKMYALESDSLSHNPSPNHRPAGSLSFLVCKMGRIIVLTS